MNLPDILNVAIGLVLIFFLLSTIASLFVELLTAVTRFREEILQITIHRLLLGGPDKPWRLTTLIYDQAVAWAVPDTKMMQGVRKALRPNDDFSQYSDEPVEQAFLRSFWTHSKIRSLVTNDAQAPAALDAETFAQVLVDLAVPKNTQGELPDNRLALDRALAVPLTNLPGQLRETLRSLTLASEIPSGATGDLLWGPFRANIARWYNEATRQATGIYREKMKRILFWVGLALAAGLNADAVRAIHVLSQDGSLRETMAAYAATVVADQETKTADPEARADLKKTRQELGDHLQRIRDVEKAGFPLGWTASEWNLMLHPVSDDAKKTPLPPGEREWAVALAFVLKLFGLLATGLAVAQGGPFWYDLMQKLIGLRKGAEGGAEGKKDDDKQSPGAKVVEGKVVPATPLPLEIGYDLTTPATGFSARKAYWLARASAAAYSPEPEVRSLIEKNWHFHEFAFFDAAGAQCFVAADEKIILVAFRGTELADIRDALADLKVALKALAAGETRRVHTGFLESYQSLDRELTQKLGQLWAANPGRQIYLTGHSLGAAMATVMFALLLIRRENEAMRPASVAAGERTGVGRKPAGQPGPAQPDLLLPPVPLLYTFGCPRVGDAEFARQLDKRYPGRIFRVENHVDVVPQLPPPAGYHHVGRQMRFNEKGEMEGEVSGFSLLLDEVAGTITKDTLKDVAEAKIAAHSISLYVALCERLARTTA